MNERDYPPQCPVCQQTVIHAEVKDRDGFRIQLDSDSLWRWLGNVFVELGYYGRSKKSCYCQNCGLLMYYLNPKEKIKLQKRIDKANENNAN